MTAEAAAGHGGCCTATAAELGARNLEEPSISRFTRRSPASRHAIRSGHALAPGRDTGPRYDWES
jgi:hypothetical protein